MSYTINPERRMIDNVRVLLCGYADFAWHPGKKKFLSINSVEAITIDRDSAIRWEAGDSVQDVECLKGHEKWLKGDLPLPRVYMIQVSHRHGWDTFLGATEKAARRLLWGYVHDSWGDLQEALSDYELEEPVDHEQAIDTYFDKGQEGQHSESIEFDGWMEVSTEEE